MKSSQKKDETPLFSRRINEIDFKLRIKRSK